MKMPIESYPVKKILWTILLLGLVIISIWGIQWATYARPPLQEAVEALDGNQHVSVSQEPWLTFSPVPGLPETGLIFYPGGRINPQGYSLLMREIAAEGYLVIVPEMPFNMAVFNPNIADEIIENYSQINHWIIAGHSVGGTMAAQYTNKHRGLIDGLMIWASYPAENADLSESDIPVVSIFGSLDPRVNENSVAERKHLLPDATEYIQIEGGGHHQFGSYEIKPEEYQAIIPRADQHEQIIRATLNLLNGVSNSN